MKALHACSHVLIGLCSLLPVLSTAANVTATQIDNAKLNSEPTFINSKESVEVKYKFKQGHTFAVNVDMKVNSKTRLAGRSFDVNVGIFMGAVFQTSKTYSNGDADLVLLIKKVKMDFAWGSRKLVFDSSSKDSSSAQIKAMTNKPVTMTVSSRGERKRANFDSLTNSIAKAGKPAIAMQLRKSMQEAVKQTMMILPEEAVKVGGIYHAGIQKNKSKIGVMENVTSFYVAGISADKKIAILRTIVKIKLTSPGGMARLTSSDVRGWIKFNLEKGRVEESRMHVKMDMKIVSDKKTMTMANTAKIHITTQ